MPHVDKKRVDELKKQIESGAASVSPGMYVAELATMQHEARNDINDEDRDLLVSLAIPLGEICKAVGYHAGAVSCFEAIYTNARDETTRRNAEQALNGIGMFQNKAGVFNHEVSLRP